MNEAILFGGTLIFAFAFRVIGKLLDNKKLNIKGKEHSAQDLLLKALSVALFFLYMPQLFMRESIAYQWGLSQEMNVGYYSIYFLPFTKTQTVFLAILKWMTNFMVANLVMMPFFDKKDSEDFATFVAPLVVVLNCIFFRPIITSILYYPGETISLYHWRAVVYACVIGLSGAIAFEKLIRVVMTRDFKDMKRRLGKMALYFLLFVFAFMPMYIPQLFFGRGDFPKAKDFTVAHRLILYFTVVFPFAMHLLFQKKSYTERHYLLVMLALSGFFSYFSQYIYPEKSFVSSLPLHLCNTAIALMLVTYVFKLNGIFYFTYFVNIMGATMAMLMPTTSGPWTTMGSISYFYNHVYAVILPFMGVSLAVFPRPKLKLMGKAIIFFTLYVLMAAIADGWLNNSPTLNPLHEEIDYFFLYSNFFIEKNVFKWAYGSKYNFIFDLVKDAAGKLHPNITFMGKTIVSASGEIRFRSYYLYNLAIYLIAIAMMFGLWGVYGLLYKIEDSHKELARRKKLMRVDRLELLKEMNGRPLSEPLHPEGANMIKISHFTKRYSGSDRKAVSDLNLEIYEGEVFGFIGHNGAGKSTTIKSLVGIQTITEGSIEIQGYDIARQPLEAKLNIGYVSDNHAVYEKLTGREYVSYVADLYMVSEKDKEERIAYYSDLFGLTAAMDNEIKSYSHGMKQKLMVISALIHNPKVWILDEPLTGLDPTSSHQIKECMRAHANAGNIVFFSSHVIEVVEKICDRVAIISGGKLRRVCTPDELVKEGHSLEELYLKYALAPVDGEEKTEETAAEAPVEASEKTAETAEKESSEEITLAEVAATTDTEEKDE